MTEACYKLRGACLEAFLCKLQEFIVCGPSDCGKTIAMCLLVHSIAKKYARSQQSVIRKTYASMRGSVLQTFNRVLFADGNCKVEIHGGQYPNLYLYPNGAKVWVGGMDKPDYILSSERDAAYVNQAEQISESDWEFIGSRCTGRGAVIPKPRVFGDCNPGPTRHWIRERAKCGRLKLINSTHKDNPELYDDTGEITPVGEERIGRLKERMTGVRYQRYVLGQWATAEGAVYKEFSQADHVKVRQPEEFVRWFMCLDAGFTNPWAIGLVGEDSDGRHHIMREYYKVGTLMQDVVQVAADWSLEMKVETAVADAARPDFVAALENAGVNAVGGKGLRDEGIHLVADRLKVQKDGKPRLTVDPSCENTMNEFESYEMEKDKDVPKKENDHMMDAYRYLLIVLGEPTGAIGSAAGIYVGANYSGAGQPRVWTPRQFTPRQR